MNYLKIYLITILTVITSVSEANTFKSKGFNKNIERWYLNDDICKNYGRLVCEGLDFPNDIDKGVGNFARPISSNAPNSTFTLSLSGISEKSDNFKFSEVIMNFEDRKTGVFDLVNYIVDKNYILKEEDTFGGYSNLILKRKMLCEGKSFYFLFESKVSNYDESDMILLNNGYLKVTIRGDTEAVYTFHENSISPETIMKTKGNLYDEYTYTKKTGKCTREKLDVKKILNEIQNK